MSEVYYYAYGFLRSYNQHLFYINADVCPLFLLYYFLNLILSDKNSSLFSMNAYSDLASVLKIKDEKCS